MFYSAAIKYLESSINYEKIPVWPYKKSLTLERIREFLNRIGNPQENLNYIHIAGSKGKGSTSAFIAYILRQAGFKVGLYTSPHLSDFRERIRILNPQTRKPGYLQTDFEGMISRRDLAGLVGKLKPSIKEFNAGSKYGLLTFFEIYTAAVFIYFKEKKVDFAVLETGLGGRLDATNVVEPLVCAITPISYEHTDKLGKTLTAIAREKAGIIKVNPQTSVVISAPQEKEALEVIKKRCKEAGAILHIVGQGKNLKIRLKGRHQLTNANVAVAAVKALSNYGIKISAQAIKKGLYNTLWPGRCEVVSQKPLIVLDGAQNVASIKVLKKAVKESFKYRKLIVVLGISNDKDIKGICNELYHFADEVILTKSSNPRATAHVKMEKYFSKNKTHLTANIKEARAKALSLANNDDLILVCGSLFVVGEFRNESL